MARLVLLRFFESYFRHCWLNLLPFALMLALAGVAVYRATPMYLSTGTFYVRKTSLLPALTQIQNDTFSWRTPTQVASGELTELVQTDVFMRSVIQKTDLESKMAGGPDAVNTTIDLVRKALTVQAVGDNLIQFSVKYEDPRIAQQLATATMDAYTQWKLNGDQQEGVVAQHFFADVLPPYQKELQRARDELKAYLETHPVPLRGERLPQEQIEIAQYQAVIDTAAKRVAGALDKEESARLAQSQSESSARQTYLVLDAPTLPSKPATSLKDTATSVGIYLVLGLVLSIVGILSGALFDQSFRFPIDVRNRLDLPILALIPDVPLHSTRRRAPRTSRRTTSPQLVAADYAEPGGAIQSGQEVISGA